MRHYFTDNTDLPEDRREHSFWFQDHEYIFTTDSGVFAKGGVDYGTMVLLESAVKEDCRGKILDIGCGYGVIGIVMKSYRPECDVTCADINPRAVELTRLNAEKNQCSIKTAVSDGFADIHEKFQMILTNPPIRAGKKVIYTIFADAYAHLEDNGCLLAVIRRQQGAESAVKELKRIFGNCEVINRDRGYWILKASCQDDKTGLS